VAGYGAGGSHLVGVDVVVFAVESRAMEEITGTPLRFQMASIQRGSLAAISPTYPRSGAVRFLRARKSRPSPPLGRPPAGQASPERRPGSCSPCRQGPSAQRRGLRVGDAQPGDEFTLLAEGREHAGQLHAAAVDHGDLIAVAHKVGNGARAASEERGILKAAPPSLTTYFIPGPPLRRSPA